MPCYPHPQGAVSHVVTTAMRGANRGRGRPRDRRNHGGVHAGNHFNDRPLQRPQEQQQQERSSTDGPSSLPSASQPLQNLDHRTKPSKGHLNPRPASRSWRGRGAKPRYVEKSEVNYSKSDADGLSSEVSSLNLEENSNSELGNENPLNSIKDSNCEDTEVRIEKIEELSNADNDEKREDLLLSVLDELRSSVSEPELTEEQLRMNDQSQEDELLAIEYIYGENIFILDKHKDMRYVQIHVHIEDSSEHIVTAKLNLHGDSNQSPDEFLFSFKTQHLPPIVLTCLLPKAYPSHLPPYFTISVRWLNPDKISCLCCVLDSIWRAQPGQEVLYQWADWLQNSSLSHVGFDNEIILGPYGITCSKDKRAVSGSQSPDADIPYIRGYNDEKCHQSFLKSLHECCICFSESAGTDFVRLPCQHFFCRKCMKTYADMHVSEGTVSKLQCPDWKCGETVPPGVLKRLLGDEEFERWESLMLQKTLESMADVVYCPRCEMPCIEDEEQHALCFKCYFSFCTLCRERRHVGVACMSPEMKLQILQERQNSSNVTEEQRRREREMINEILSVKEILKDAKQCPSCKMAISRTEGCNKMVCDNCGQYFCYRCNKAITGYEHFREGTCELFPQEMIQHWEERVNARQAVGQIQAQIFARHGQLCPNCRQFNAKLGNNNHLFCWACQTHYCYLCKKIVKRCAQHYGPKGCKQHTEG